MGYDGDSGLTGLVGVEADGENSCFSNGAGRERIVYVRRHDTPAPTDHV